MGRGWGEGARAAAPPPPRRPRPPPPLPALGRAAPPRRVRHRARAETAGFPPRGRDSPRSHPAARPHQSSAARPARPPTAVSHPRPHAVPAVEARSHLGSVLVASPARSHLCPARRAGFFPVSALKMNALQHRQAGRLFPQRGIARLQRAVGAQLSQGLYLCVTARSAAQPGEERPHAFLTHPGEGAVGSDLGVPAAVGCGNPSSVRPTLHGSRPRAPPALLLAIPLEAGCASAPQDFTNHSLQEVPQSCPFSSGSPAGCTISMRLSTPYKTFCIYKMCLHSAASPHMAPSHHHRSPPSPPDTFSPSSKGSEEQRISSGLLRAAV